MYCRPLVCAALAALVFPAPALAISPVWSAGVHLGSLAVPNTHPITFPTRIKTYDFDRDDVPDDVDDDGFTDQSTLTLSRGDVIFGVEGWYWLNDGNRLGINTGFDLGERFTRAQLLAIYDATLDTGSMAVVLGGGLGFGTASWRGTDKDERLRVPSFPVRVEAGVMVPPTEYLAIEARLFGQMDIPTRHAYFDIAGNPQDVKGVAFSYAAIGFEIAVNYGQFD